MGMKQVENKAEACLAEGNVPSALEKEAEQTLARLHSSTPVTKPSWKPLDTASYTCLWR